MKNYFDKYKKIAYYCGGCIYFEYPNKKFQIVLTKKKKEIKEDDNKQKFIKIIATCITLNHPDNKLLDELYEIIKNIK